MAEVSPLKQLVLIYMLERPSFPNNTNMFYVSQKQLIHVEPTNSIDIAGITMSNVTPNKVEIDIVTKEKIEKYKIAHAEFKLSTHENVDIGHRYNWDLFVIVKHKENLDEPSSKIIDHSLRIGDRIDLTFSPDALDFSPTGLNLRSVKHNRICRIGVV